MSVVARHELLAAATPRPWYVVGAPWNEGEPWICTSDDPHAGHFIADVAGELDGERLEDREPRSDAVLIVAAVNEYEALLACEAGLRALVGLLRPDNRHAIHARDALERLDDIRNAKETRT